jgi:hypothetical protein
MIMVHLSSVSLLGVCNCVINVIRIIREYLRRFIRMTNFPFLYVFVMLHWYCFRFVISMSLYVFMIHL